MYKRQAIAKCTKKKKIRASLTNQPNKTNTEGSRRPTFLKREGEERRAKASRESGAGNAQRQTTERKRRNAPANDEAKPHCSKDQANDEAKPHCSKDQANQHKKKI